MRLRTSLCAVAVVLVTITAAAQQQPAAQPVLPLAGSPTALTIYNEDFAVARTLIDLDLHAGMNEVKTNEVTTQLEPDSVVLTDVAVRGSSRKPGFQIVEQNYDSGIITQDWLLNKFEGKTIEFQIGSNGVMVDGHVVKSPIVEGKIIRAPQTSGSYTQPLIEVDGKLEFQLPGTPLFPASTDGLMLKPTLRWQIDSERKQQVSAELAYITGGLSWEATYNVVLPGDAVSEPAAPAKKSAEEKADFIGWASIHNQSGTDFAQAKVKLMAGDVAKIAPRKNSGTVRQFAAMANFSAGAVSEKPFDDFHLYDLNRTVSLHTGEIKQIQFIEASEMTVSRSYIYDGATEVYQPGSSFVQQQNYGLNSGNTTVHIVEEFKNTHANHLGIPLPAGRIRLYRRDVDGQMEFVGESTINHTPAEGAVKISTGTAFDVKGSRRQVDFHINQTGHTVDESFEIDLTNQKADSVTVNVVEHLYRGDNWELRNQSVDSIKRDSFTIQFPVKVPSKGEAKLTYAVHYTW